MKYTMIMKKTRLGRCFGFDDSWFLFILILECLYNYSQKQGHMYH
jgi:hypothetical protein